LGIVDSGFRVEFGADCTAVEFVRGRFEGPVRLNLRVRRDQERRRVAGRLHEHGQLATRCDVRLTGDRLVRGRAHDDVVLTVDVLGVEFRVGLDGREVGQHDLVVVIGELALVEHREVGLVVLAVTCVRDRIHVDRDEVRVVRRIVLHRHVVGAQHEVLSGRVRTGALVGDVEPGIAALGPEAEAGVTGGVDIVSDVIHRAFETARVDLEDRVVGRRGAVTDRHFVALGDAASDVRPDLVTDVVRGDPRHDVVGRTFSERERGDVRDRTATGTDVAEVSRRGVHVVLRRVEDARS